MAARFQACALVSPPTFPNAIAWSEENLIAVATGHIVTILNPALPCGPRGLIMLPAPKPFQIGVIESIDLSSPGMLPICLSRYTDRPCVRSVSWSPIGMAPNSGCLLAVCTLEGQVKLYRSPYCEFKAEWVEIIDVAELLFDHLAKIYFEESNAFHSEARDEHAAPPSQTHAHDDDVPVNISHKRVKSKDSEPLGGIKKSKPVGSPFLSQHVNYESGNAGITFHADESVSNITQREIIPYLDINENYPTTCVPRQPKKHVKEKLSSESRLNSRHQKAKQSAAGPSISAEEYISRNAMMSSLIVAWSPLMSSSSKVDIRDRFSLLAVGGKSGKISFWRFREPCSYFVNNNGCRITTIFAGFLHAHNAWITAISWVTLDDLSKGHVVLVTGSADGSVKIWFQHENELLSTEDGQVSFNLMTEIVAVDSSPVSALSVAVPVESLDKLIVAIGKGSGSFEVWTCDFLLNIFDKIGTYNTHDHVITGLAWAFGGRCLYSCSQVLQCILTSHPSSISIFSGLGVTILSGPGSYGKVPYVKQTFPQTLWIPNASDSSFGIAISPGNLVLAMARSFDTSLLDQMYQARCLKGAVEFFWIGGQEVELLPDTRLEINLDESPEFSEKELLHWSANMLSSLKHFEDSNKSLVIWDAVAALLAFKDSIPEYVEYVLVRWLSTVFAFPNVSSSLEEILTFATTRLQSRSCRQLHIISIICRRVVLSELKEEELNNQYLQLTSNDDEQEFLPLWIELLSNIDREIRERLVGLSLSAASVLMPCSSRNSSGTEIWRPLGLAQMQQWVALNNHLVPENLKLLASKAGQLIDRASISCDYAPLEKCSFCAASVAFESPEIANCSPNEKSEQSHRLERCAVSMRVCPTTPVWHCVCCRRRAFTIAPVEFFKMSRHPLNYVIELKGPSKPLCPFCGLLQQGPLTAFLLSPTPV
ncbi:unnamed protein product [Rhodiola kirilowii]